MKEVPSTCPECGDSFVATLCDSFEPEWAELPCSPECNLALVESTGAFI